MTRKRRKTRSRQERTRVHARTKQTFRQAHRRGLEKIWADAARPSPWLRLLIDGEFALADEWDES